MVIVSECYGLFKDFVNPSSKHFLSYKLGVLFSQKLKLHSYWKVHTKWTFKNNFREHLIFGLEVEWSVECIRRKRARTWRCTLFENRNRFGTGQIFSGFGDFYFKLLGVSCCWSCSNSQLHRIYHLFKIRAFSVASANISLTLLHYFK